MERDFYYTIEQSAEGFLKEKASKFFAYAFPTKNEEAVKDALEILRKKHYDARHHCYAYRLGQYGEITRANDDGEPSNSAGKPILGQLQAFDVTNCLIVVVRYFGGTKLGVGGLIQAYKESAKEALENAEILKKTIDKQFTVHFGYNEMNTVMRILKNIPATDIVQNFQENCIITFSIREGEADSAVAKFSNLKNIEIQPIKTP
ncbi:MAG: YigZ family protein [Flavobacteriales bacterium]|jgi:uncharacterized YigZ family protein|nr:YigZ family protein [Flavobacteriales bacterium]